MEFELLLQFIQPIQDSIKILNDHSGIMTADIAVLKTQMGELVYWGRFVMGGILIIVIERIVSVALTIKKNGKK